jgi:RNA polymerase sigma factor (sigma-70 family)
MLFERHREAAQRLARQLARGPSDADDLVAEAFERVLRQLREGKGPDVSFRAYLLTTLRHVHFRRHAAEKRAVTTDDDQVLDRPTEEKDTVVAEFDNAAASRAFGSLPERWQMILWHLEVEGQRPAEVADLLGLKPNAVSALAYRAREALRQAYLLQHIADAPDESHVAILDQLPALVRNKLGRRDTEKVRRHLADCLTCSAAYAELTDMNSRLSAFLAPVVLGAAAAPYLRDVPSSAFTVVRHPWQRLQHWIHYGPAGVVAVRRTTTTLAALVIVGGFVGGLWAAQGSLFGVEADTHAAPPSSTPTVPPPSTSTTPSAPSPSGTGPATPAGTPTTTPTTTPTGSATTSPTPSAITSSSAPTGAPDTGGSAPSSPSSSPTATTRPPVPPVRASFQTAPNGLSVTVRGSASGGSGGYSYVWRFGDGATGSGQTAAHTYAGSGTYTVTLTASDGTRSRTVSRSVSVYAENEPPSAAFSTTLSGATVTVDASASADQDGTITGYQWDFGDDTTGTGKVASHTYPAAGEYLVRLTVTDDRGARASRVTTVVVDNG